MKGSERVKTTLRATIKWTGTLSRTWWPVYSLILIPQASQSHIGAKSSSGNLLLTEAEIHEMIETKNLEAMAKT